MQTFRSIGKNTQERDLFRCAENRCQRGWRAVVVRKTAKRVEHEQPAIYEHFRSEDEILLEISRRGYAEQLEVMRATRQVAEGAKEVVCGVWRAYVDFAEVLPTFTRLCTVSRECRILKRKLARWASRW